MAIGGSIGTGDLTGSIVGEPEAVATGTVGFGIIIALIFVLVFSLVIFALMIYAIPLILFNALTLVEAMKSSAKATVLNAIPLLVFGTVYIVLAVIKEVPESSATDQ